VINNEACKLSIVNEKFTPLAGSQMEGASMKDDKNWFGAKFPAETRVGLMHSLFAPLFRAPAKSPAPKPKNSCAAMADSGADACWTASLHRGSDLPPFLLCIHTTAESRSAVRFGPLDRDIGADSLGAKL
jgi:hypothetical protein